MPEMIDMELARQHREEVLREVAPNRRAKALLAPVGEVPAGDQPWRGRRNGTSGVYSSFSVRPGKPVRGVVHHSRQP